MRWEILPPRWCEDFSLKYFSVPSLKVWAGTFPFFVCSLYPDHFPINARYSPSPPASDTDVYLYGGGGTPPLVLRTRPPVPLCFRSQFPASMPALRIGGIVDLFFLLLGSFHLAYSRPTEEFMWGQRPYFYVTSRLTYLSWATIAPAFFVNQFSCHQKENLVPLPCVPF